MKRAAKQRLLALARSARLLPALERGRFLIEQRRTQAANRAFLDAHPDFAPPPAWWMHDMYRHTSYADYWRTGVEAAFVLTSKISAHLGDAVRVADWGCGLARVVRHLPDHYGRHGFDYNAAAIDWNVRNIDGVEFAVNGLMPPLPAADASFDALYCLSVFTHLSAEAHDAWIAEIARVLRPGGVFIGAFHMRPQAGQLLPAEQARFDAGELVVRGGVREGSRNYTAYHPESWLRGRFLAGWRVLEPPFILHGQWLYAVRKP